MIQQIERQKVLAALRAAANKTSDKHQALKSEAIGFKAIFEAVDPKTCALCEYASIDLVALAKAGNLAQVMNAILCSIRDVSNKSFAARRAYDPNERCLRASGY